MSHIDPCADWECLYRNERLGRVRFVQFASLALAGLCIYLLHLAVYGRPDLVSPVPSQELVLIIPLCLAGILLPNIGMAVYLHRYVLSFEVCDERARLRTPRFLGSSNIQEFSRSDFLGKRTEKGHFVSLRAVIVHAPWIWLLIPNLRYILDEQCAGGNEVVAWIEQGLAKK